jgi:hypothetical protein
MFLELIAVFIAGFAGAGAVMLLNRLTGGRLPRWLVPIGAGAAMLGTTISSEYNWYGRTAGGLPEGLQVAQTVQTSAAWRPWSYVFPVTERFSAVDMGNLRPNSTQDGLVMADVYFFGRWKAAQAVQILVDCPARRRADPALGDGSPPVWRDVPPDDAVVTTVCGAPAS